MLRKSVPFSLHEVVIPKYEHLKYQYSSEAITLIFNNKTQLLCSTADKFKSLHQSIASIEMTPLLFALS